MAESVFVTGETLVNRQTQDPCLCGTHNHMGETDFAQINSIARNWGTRCGGNVPGAEKAKIKSQRLSLLPVTSQPRNVGQTTFSLSAASLFPSASASSCFTRAPVSLKRSNHEKDLLGALVDLKMMITVRKVSATG